MDNRIPWAVPPVDVAPLYGFLSSCSAGFKQFCALSAAVNLKIFDLIDRHQTVDSLAGATRADRLMLEDLCEILTDQGFLERVSEGYRNTPLSRTFLAENSTWYQGEVIKNFIFGFQLWERLAQICQNGPITLNPLDLFGGNNFIRALQAEILTGELQRTVSIVSAIPEFGSAENLLDLGGGHGLHAIAFSKVNPRLNAVIFDLPPLEQYARSLIEQYQAMNVRFVSGNMFADDFGKEYDVVFFSYNPGGKNRAMLEKIHGSLKVGGLFITKHVFYRENEGSKNRLCDLEWKLTAISGLEKGKHIYSFPGDLSFEEYLTLLEQRFTILKLVEASEFAKPPLNKFGDIFDSVIIVGRKKGGPDGSSPA